MKFKTFSAVGCAALLLSAAPLFAQATGGGTVIVGGGVPGHGTLTKSADRPSGVHSPVPKPLLAAHKIFLSNDGSDAGLFPHPFTGTQDRGYGYLLNALSHTSALELVDSPAEADVIIELTLAAPTGAIGADKRAGTADPLPYFHAVLYDRPSHYVLWSLTQTIDKANLQKTHDKNFDDALDLLLKNMLNVFAGVQEAPAPPPAPPEKPFVAE